MGSEQWEREFLQALMLEILEDWGLELANTELNRLASELAKEAVEFLTSEDYDEEYEDYEPQGELF